jgi:crotonobetainyl-CoA:carnitine CoA-transferase CaiB-like acyl-CoA transferase
VRISCLTRTVDQAGPNSSIMPRPTGPLAGVRVADLTNVVMGPLATRMLADMGADVIRIEGPAGDVVREYEPMRHPLMSAFHLNLNRNKRSVDLDLKTEAGQEAVRDLIASCDVFVTNIRRSAIDRLGLDEASVRELRPDIIYCIANGYGSDGPRAHQSAYDDVMQAASGLASTFQWFEDEPRLVPSLLGDKVSGIHIAFAIAAALHQRARTGEGAGIEVPMAETLAAFNLVEHLGGKTFEPQHGDFSYARLRTPTRRPRKTADGWAVIMPYSEANWHRFFDFIGRPELKSDPRFASANGRVDHATELYGLIDDAGPSRTTADWLAFCDEHSIPAAEVVDLEHIDEDEHFRAVGLIQHVEHPTEGSIRYVRDPIIIDGEPTPLFIEAPTMGQHTGEVLAELGWSPERIAEFLDAPRASG